MKVTMEIDCTPEEARTFFGLPDVKPLQEAMMAQMEAKMTEAAAAMSPDALLKSWMNALQGAPQQMQEMFTQFFRSR